MSPDKKKLYMWLCAGGSLVVIAIIWVASIQFSVSASVTDLGESKKKGMETLDEFQKNFKKQLDDLENKFNSPAAGPELSRGVATSTAVTSTTQ